jgi:hypothetical protein
MTRSARNWIWVLTWLVCLITTLVLIVRFT